MKEKTGKLLQTHCRYEPQKSSNHWSGISNQETFNQATQFAKGAIIGSAFIKNLTDNGVGSIGEFVKAIRKIYISNKKQTAFKVILNVVFFMIKKPIIHRINSIYLNSYKVKQSFANLPDFGCIYKSL